MSARRPGNGYWTSHLMDARLEDARFILAHGGSMAEAARRVGVPQATLEKELERHPEKEPA